MAGNDPEANLAEDASEEEGFDLERAKELAGFVLNARRRHKALATIVSVVCLGATVLAVLFVPRTYESEVKILAQRNLVIPALGNPMRSVPRDADNPTRDAADTILKRDNLIALVKQLDLIDRWHAQRPPALRAKDWLLGFVAPKPTPEQEVRSLVGLLEKQITITTDENSIGIAVIWATPQLAYEIASLLQKNFVDARYDSDIAMIDDALAILEEHAKTEHDQMEVALADLDKAIGESQHVPAQAPAQATAPSSPSSAPHGAAQAAYVPAAPRAPAAPSQDLASLKLLDQERAAIKQIQSTRDQHLQDLNRQLEDALGTYAPAHPTVIALKQRIEEAKKDPPELAALVEQEADLESRVAAAPADAPAGSTTARSTAGGATARRDEDTAAAVLARVPPPQPGDSAEVTLAHMNLQNATFKYTDLESRIDSAKIELDVTRAAFKYRFNVVSPAEVPLKAKKPNVVVLALGGLVASLVLGFVAAVAKDLASGRFLEPWQVERRLKLPLLGELESTTPTLGGPTG